MNSCKYYHALGQVTYTLLTGRTLCHCSAPHRQDHHKDKTRLRQAQQLLLSLVQQSLLSLAQQTLLSLAQQSLPNWPNIYKFAISTKVTLLLSNINDDNEDIKMLVTAATEGFDTDNPVVQLMTVIKVIESMDLWASQVMDNWITYHLTRNQLREDIDVERVVADNTFQQSDDMCQALILWDCKMAKEMKSMLNTLLFHYITLEDMVLEATGSLAEIPQTPRNCSLYV